jgi:hypothetical protein
VLQCTDSARPCADAAPLRWQKMQTVRATATAHVTQSRSSLPTRAAPRHVPSAPKAGSDPRSPADPVRPTHSSYSASSAVRGVSGQILLFKKLGTCVNALVCSHLLHEPEHAAQRGPGKQARRVKNPVAAAAIIQTYTHTHIDIQHLSFS